MADEAEELEGLNATGSSILLWILNTCAGEKWVKFGVYYLFGWGLKDYYGFGEVNGWKQGKNRYKAGAVRSWHGNLHKGDDGSLEDISCE